MASENLGIFAIILDTDCVSEKPLLDDFRHSFLAQVGVLFICLYTYLPTRYTYSYKNISKYCYFYHYFNLVVFWNAAQLCSNIHSNIFSTSTVQFIAISLNKYVAKFKLNIYYILHLFSRCTFPSMWSTPQCLGSPRGPNISSSPLKPSSSAMKKTLGRRTGFLHNTAKKGQQEIFLTISLIPSYIHII